MYPFGSRLKWHLSGRHAHLIAIVQSRGLQLRGPLDTTLRERLRALKRWGAVRAVAFGVLYLGFIVAGLSLLARLVPALDEARDALAAVASVTGTLSGVMALFVILVSRFLGQVEVDILGYLLTWGKAPADG